MTKPGYLTTEFWATVLLNVGVVASAIQGSLPPKWAGICSTIAVAVYALARALTKVSTRPPVIPPAANATPAPSEVAAVASATQ